MPTIDTYGTRTGEAGLSYGLNGITDWTTSQPFLDVFKTARPWIGHEDGQWGGLEYSEMQEQGLLDDNGYLTEMPEGISRTETFVLTEMPPEAEYTAGRYRLTWDGQGEVAVTGGVSDVTYGDGEIWFDYTPTGDSLVGISFGSTDPDGTGDYLRNFSLVKEDNIGAFEDGALFNPDWLDLVGEAHALRFMDWIETNNSDLTSWEDRPETGDFTWATGVPVEIMVELANQTGTEPWFNIPHDADDAYIEAFATYVQENLDPGLRAHFEFSNEVWNFMFDQASDSSADAVDRFGEDLSDGWMQEYGARAAEMAQILDEVFAGNSDRLVKVIATHTGWPGLEESILEAPDYVALDPSNAAPYTLFDTYAITGYFGASLGNEKAETVLGWLEQSQAAAEADADAQGLTGSARTDWIEAHRYDAATDLAIAELRDGSITGNASGSLAELFENFAYHAGVAESYGLDLVMYEGGTHVVTTGQWTGNQALSDFFIHLNYSDGMGELYSELLAGWEDAGGTLFNAFVETSTPSQWGSWGSLRWLGDETARQDALEDFADEHPRDEGSTDPVTPDEPVDPVTPTDPEAPADPENPDEGGLIEGGDGDDAILHDANGRTEHGDTILGWEGNDVLYDGAGSDTLDGGDGYDLISLWEDNNTLDVVENFDPGMDILDLSPQGIYALSQLIVAQVGDSADLMIDFGGDRVILRGMWDIDAGAPRVGEDNLILAHPPEGADMNPAPEPYTGPMPGVEVEVPGEDPEEPTEPEAPTDPVEPEEPTDPVTPEEPTEPETPAETPVDAVREYIFGHSLINHASGDPATAVPWWLDAFSDAEEGHSYAFAGQYGFLQQHDDLPPSSQWGIEGVDGAWDPEAGESFADADFTHVTITPGNFIQWQGPDEPYWNDPETTPISATLDLIDFVTEAEPGVTIMIYENWPDMAPFITNFPPTDAEFDNWCDYLRGDFDAWWQEYAGALQQARPDADIRLVPVGPLLADMLQSPTLGLDDVPIEQLFSDDAPHGTASLYFLAAIIHHAALFGATPAAGFEVPEGVHPDIIEAWPEILQFVADEMAVADGGDIDPETPTDPVEPTDPEAPTDPEEPEEPEEPTEPEEPSDPESPGQGALLEGSGGDDLFLHDAEGRTEFGDTIRGGAGNDILYDGQGSDVLDGGEGYDLISLWEDGNTLDIVENFDPGTDMLDLSPQGIYDLSQLIVAQLGDSSDLMIDFGGDRVILRGMWDIDSGQPRLGEDNLLLAGPPAEGGAVPAPEPYTGPMPEGAIGQPSGEIEEPEEPLPPALPDPEDGPAAYEAYFEGSDGADILRAEDTDDFIFAGGGNDLIYGSSGADHIDGGTGKDRVQYQDHGQDIVIDMTDASASTGSAHGDTFANIERIQSGNGNDTIRLAAGVRGDGGGGNDVIIDAGGREEMHGGNGADIFVFLDRDGQTDRIIDFTSGEDLIDLTGWDVTLADVTISGDAQGRAYIDVEGDRLRIDHGWDAETGTALFTIDDFVF